MSKPKDRPPGAGLLLAELFAFAKGKGLSIKKIAFLANMNYEYLVNVKTGRVANPSIHTLYAIATAIGVKLKWTPK